jgi:hypothetical protein
LALKITGALPKEPVEAFSGWDRFAFRPWVGWINKQLLLLNSWKKLMQASF